MTNNDLSFSLAYNLSNNVKDADFTDGNDNTSYDALLTGTEDHNDIVGIIKATSPSGIMYGATAYDSYDFTSPDIDGSVPDYEETGIALDTDSTTGDVLNGDYLWEYMVRLNLSAGIVDGYNASGYFEITHPDDYSAILGGTPTGLKLQIYDAGANDGVYDITTISYTVGGVIRIAVTSPPTAWAATGGELAGIIFTKTETLEYCFSADPQTDIEVVSDCVCSKLTSTDNSNYETSCNGVSISPNLPISRSHKIYYPSGIFPTPRPITEAHVGSKYFKIAGNYVTQIENIGYISVINSTDNDGLYTVSSAVYSAGYTTVTTIEAPTSATADGQVQLGVLEYGTAVVEVSPIYTKTWTAYVEADLVYVLPSGITVNVTASGSQEHEVSCSDCMCCLATCIENIQTRYETAISTGNTRESNRLNIILQKIIAHFSLYLIARDCGETAEMNSQLTTITELVNGEDCNCPDNTDDDIPVKIIPLCGDVSSGSGSSTVVAAGTGGITVSSAVVGLTTTYTVSLGSISVAWSSITGTPTTLGDYGILNAWTKAELAAHTPAAVHYDNLTNVPHNVPSCVQLHSRYTDASASGGLGADEQLDAYTISGGTIRDGEVLQIRAVFSVVASANTNKVGIKFNGTEIIYLYDGSIDRDIELKLTAVVNSTTGLRITKIATGSGSPASLDSAGLCVNYGINMSSTNLVVSTYTNRAVANTVTQKLFMIEHLKI